MNRYTRIFFSFLLLLVSISLVSQENNTRKYFQRINLYPYSIHAVTASEKEIAVNLDNNIVKVFTLIENKFELLNSYNLNGLTDEFGTMEFHDGLLYVSIDGYKYYKIDPLKTKTEKTNNFDAGFYIKSNYGPDFENQYWKLTEGKKGEVIIYKIEEE